MSVLKLSRVIYGGGEGGTPVLVMAGLFGSKQNWRSLSKAMSQKLAAPVIALDLRNHGESPHSEVHDFPSMANDLELLCNDLGIKRAAFMGHSMGGKAAMHFAITRPQMVTRLIVADIAPIQQRLSSEFGGYIERMKIVEAAKVANASQADAILAETIKDVSIRQFLLTNLKNVDGENFMKFRVNLDALYNSLNRDISSFPIAGSGKIFPNPTLFIRGIRANYVPKSSEPEIKRLFPDSRIVDIDAGHWVHAEKPDEFLSHVISFLK